jgi:hypothetical protein
MSVAGASRAIVGGRRRKAILAAAAVTLGLGVGLLIAAFVLAVDVYLHHRVQNLGGVNVWGYRGPVTAKKQPGEVRIVAIGGSTTFGYGLPWNESWPYYLERKLNRSKGSSRIYSVINLGAPAQGAFGFRYDLEDYAYLHYDAAILYEGYNDLGDRDLPEAVPTRTGPNYFLWRRQSPVFRLTGYMPVLPLVFREKAMAMKSGGHLDAAYRGVRTEFKPGLATRATAAALETAAAIADRAGSQLGYLSSNADAIERQSGDVESWRHYVASELGAIEYARTRGVKVLVVTQPYASDTHVAQQRALASAIASRFQHDGGVAYVNLGRLLNVRDREVAYDGLHLVAAANERVANALVTPVMTAVQ